MQALLELPKKGGGGKGAYFIWNLYIDKTVPTSINDDYKDLTEAINYKSNNIDNIF